MTKVLLFLLFIGFCASPIEKSNEKNAILRRSTAKKAIPLDTTLISRIVGTASDQVVTSREVKIVNLLEKSLIAEKNLDLVSLDDARFNLEVGQVLLEIVVQAESNVFDFHQVTDLEFKDAHDRVQKSLSSSKEWNALQVSNSELERFLRRKLVSKKFIKIKSDSMKGFITDSEAKEYFDKNRLKFGQVPFSQFKENIKTFLSQQQLEERLKAWFEIIKKKYKVKNYTNEAS